ncbi:hypothetical protein AKJ41_02475 [candidate division MSBL1 archaeon SCGC-AAA259O05]|uniref:Uncharacterized protein n=1 Tax=candidate division MSBL1 archaeon SCGC-AAA259O05 TaxID=1698271 RepID=A0A133V3Z8_9EURY|nr:hypothetical protein AKJ41_02475 [candidate division MSBL1 archaeon SCGC-AAA259O05]
MARKIVCRLFPERAESHVENGRKSGEVMREKEYRLEIPERHYRKLERQAKKEQVGVDELIERRFFGVGDLPEEWTAALHE